VDWHTGDLRYGFTGWSLAKASQLSNPGPHHNSHRGNTLVSLWGIYADSYFIRFEMELILSVRRKAQSLRQIQWLYNFDNYDFRCILLIFVAAYMKPFLILFAFFFVGINHCYPQVADTTKSAGKVVVQHYFIISAGTVINAYFNDKPLSVETISEFDEYIQRNAKILKDSRVVVTGKPKNGTFDEVLKTLSHYRIKNVTKNILTN
jgi:hypothetical protein